MTRINKYLFDYKGRIQVTSKCQYANMTAELLVPT
jgi:hypothetical protein